MHSRITFVGLLLLAPALPAQELAAVSEKDFLGDMPVVLSVSRLPQRLDETPGSVTVIDRQMIRMSGARDVADLMRLVPGFRVSTSFESNAPQASYHGNWGDYSNHVQVMVDGRSVYSPFLLGSTGPGLQSVAVEDIERIEVMRGSNSAAYGARAFLGTINIVTRDPVDAQGLMVRVNGGDNAIQDGMARIGWGDDRARFRLSADRRSDDGLSGASGPARVSRVNFRADLTPVAGDQIELRAGQSVIDAGVGFANQDGNAVRTRSIDTAFVQFDWRRSLGQDEDLSLQMSHMQERDTDAFAYAPIPGLTIDFSGRASTDHVSLQHSFRKGRDLRVVWGGELRRETVVSRPLFDTDAAFVTDFTRLFTNVEWRLRPDWVLNAGGMFERSNLSGTHLSPRLMLHWHLAEGHTLRYGLSRSYRPPSAYEKFGSVRYYDPSTGSLLDSTTVARGSVQAESVQAREIGYLGDLPRWGLSVDVRLFEEDVRDVIRSLNYSLPGSGSLDTSASDFVNSDNFNIHGVEYMVKWQPWRGGRLIVGESHMDGGWTDNGGFRSQPFSSTSLMFMQQLPGQWDFSLMHFRTDATNFPGMAAMAPAVNRTDLRVAKEMRLGSKRAEVAFVVQNLGPAYPDFISSFHFRRQAFLTLKLEN